MNADEARALNDEYAAKQQLSLETIETQIQIAATKGESGILVDLTGIDYSYRERIYEKIKIQLEEKGFGVKRNTWSCRHSDDSGDAIAISW